MQGNLEHESSSQSVSNELSRQANETQNVHFWKEKSALDLSLNPRMCGRML